MLKKLFVVALLCFSAPVFAGGKIAPPDFKEDSRNPAPSTALNAFQRFDLAPVAMGAPWKGQDANEAALANLQANVDIRVKPVVAEWNAKPAADAPRTLKIEPEIAYIRFITGGKRFFAGAFAGDSGILLKVKLSDAATGEVIGEPQFYQRANKFGATWSFGATDKHMLIRMSAMVADYLKTNYAAPAETLVMVAPGHEEDLNDK